MRAQQFDDNLIDTTVSNIQMDTLDVRYSISFGYKTKEDVVCQSVCCVFYLQIDKLLFVVFFTPNMGYVPQLQFLHRHTHVSLEGPKVRTNKTGFHFLIFLLIFVCYMML